MPDFKKHRKQPRHSLAIRDFDIEFNDYLISPTYKVAGASTDPMPNPIKMNPKQITENE